MKIIDKISTTNVEELRENKPESIIVHSTKKYPNFNSLYNLHVNKNHWNGIGYHFFIDQHGKIYSIRPLDKEGAHAWGFNLNSIGICFYNGSALQDRLSLGKDLIKHNK
jgi:hypothetical protein